MAKVIPQTPARVESVRLRPAVMATGALLVTGGVISAAVLGLGLFSITFLLLGSLTFLGTFLFNFLLRNREDLSPTDSGGPAGEQDIKRYVFKTQYLEHTDNLGERAAEQFGHVSARYKKLVELVAAKFDRTEITYERYSTAVTQAYESVLANLKRAADALNSVSQIDPKALAAQLKQAQDDATRASLAERSQLREQHLATIRGILDFNEQAITEMDRIAAALGATQTRRGDTPMELEQTMSQLRELADRAKKYSVGGS